MIPAFCTTLGAESTPPALCGILRTAQILPFAQHSLQTRGGTSIARRRGFLLSPPRKIALLIAMLLWLAGVGFYIPGLAPVLAELAAAVPAVETLPAGPGVWCLAASELLMFAGVIFQGI